MDRIREGTPTRTHGDTSHSPSSEISDPGKCLPLVILTACSRPQNLATITSSIRAHLYDHSWHWIVCSEKQCTITQYDALSEHLLFHNIGGPTKRITPGISSHPKIKDHCHYGKPLLNHSIDMMQSHSITGLVMFLDDDTIVIPETRSAIRTFCRNHFPSKMAFTVRQIDSKERIRINTVKNPHRIDQGSYFLHSDLIGKHRFFATEDSDPRLFYEADRQFYRSIRTKSEEMWVDLPVVGSIYNALR